jgi:hypothetical protein
MKKCLAACSRLDDPLWAPVLMMALTAGATVLGLWLKWSWSLPILQAAVAWPFFAASCSRGGVLRAAARILVFAAVAGSVVTAAVAAAEPDHYNSAVPRGAAYRDEMFSFIRSGGLSGEEATPSQFLPMHALHCGVFALLCAATAGFGGLVLGAFLLDYMSYYVGALLYEASQHGEFWKTALCSWAPYAVIRVIAYAVLGAGIVVILYGPTTSRRTARNAILVGIALAVVDVVLKAFAAHLYGQTLLRTTGIR